MRSSQSGLGTGPCDAKYQRFVGVGGAVSGASLSQSLRSLRTSAVKNGPSTQVAVKPPSVTLQPLSVGL